MNKEKMKEIFKNLGNQSEYDRMKQLIMEAYETVSDQYPDDSFNKKARRIEVALPRMLKDDNINRKPIGAEMIKRIIKEGGNNDNK